MIKYLLILPCLFLCFSSVSGQNLLTNSCFETGTLGADTAPTDWNHPTGNTTDYNDPSSTTNDPRPGSGGDEMWDDFYVVGGNESSNGGRAVGSDHRSSLAYDFGAETFTEGDCYVLYFQMANPGLTDDAGVNTHNGDGYFRFRLANSGWLNGPTIPMGTSGTMEWFSFSISLTAGNGAPNELRLQSQNAGTDDSYLMIDNIILVPVTVPISTTDLSGGCATTYNLDDFCFPNGTCEADLLPGDHFVNTGNCDIAAGDPDDLITVPTFDCADAVAVTFDIPDFPTPEILYHYWGNCAPLSPRMPNGIHPRSNGFIQQMFCATDTFGLPAFPGGLSSETGVIDFLPESSADVGCNGFAEVGTCECGDSSGPERNTEIIQLDFWLAVPEIQAQVGFRFSTNATQDAASFFVGPALDEMCEVAYFADGTVHDALPDQLTGTYNIDKDIHSGECGVLWMRVRIYINDINDQFAVNPQLNAGDGWVNISQLFTLPATSALDNTPPTVPTQTATGYFVDDMFFFDDGGVWAGFGCNAIVTAVDPGACPPADPSIALSKNDLGPDSQTVVPGTDVDFTITVVNNGDENLCSVVMTDAMCDVLTGPVGDGGVTGTMEVGETWTYICTVNNATATYTNTAMVTAQGCASTTPVMFQDPSEVIVCVAPDLATVATPAICAGATFDLTTIIVTDAQSGNYPMGAIVTTTYHTAIPANAINVVPSTMVTPAATTTYYIVYTNDNGTPGDTADDCSDELAVTVTVNDCGTCLPPDISTTATPAICTGATFDLTTIVVTDAQAGNYPAAAIVTTSYHTATPAGTGNVVASTMVTPGVTTTYYILYTNDNETPGDTADDCSDELAVTVTVNDCGTCLSPDIATTATPAICAGATFDLSTIAVTDAEAGNYPAAANVTITYHAATPATTGNAIGNMVSPTATTMYYILYTNDNETSGDTADDCSDELAVTVTVNVLPTLEAIPATNVCADVTPVSLAVYNPTLTAGTAGGAFVWYADNSGAPDIAGGAITSASTSGTYWVVYTEPSPTMCAGQTSMILTVNELPAEPTTACWQTATFNSTTCMWDVTGTQPTEPTTACWQTANFNNTTCVWDVTGTQPTEPTTACWQTATFNNTTCVWDVTGTQPTEPTTACWQTATFNNTTCVWDVTGTQPTEPTTACWQTATFNNTTCVWDVTGTQPTEPTTACWQTATFNNTTCVWDVTGTQATEPTTACWQTATFNNTTCVWDVTGTQPTAPTTACWQTATFNNTTCVWDVTGTQATEPTTACWQTATFNNTTCVWDVTGTQATEPTSACWQTATFNNTTCVWDVTGTQATEPTTACWQTATFNNTTCVWDVTGTQPTAPTTACWQTATFNNTTCVWDVTGTQPSEPTIECYEVATFNNTICEWEVSGSETMEPFTQCWETATFDDIICNWEITGTQPTEPTTECWETATFNNTTCVWDITGTQDAVPSTECWETATFNNTTCAWDVTGTQGEGLTGEDICESLDALGVDSPFHGIDCDHDGETNEEECDNGTDPLDPCDNSYEDGDAICAAIDAGANGFAGLDCDGGGVNDEDECEDGTDPTDPCDDAGLTGQDICDNLDALGVDSPFRGIDCDGDGETNEEECDNGTDPLDPCDNSYEDGDAICAAIDAGANGFVDVDCDGGGVNDEQECDDGTDPTNPCDDAGLTGQDICDSLDALGVDSPFHGIDCDGDGETNEEECDNGTDPLDPCDNSYEDGDEICAAIDAGANGFVDVDCDGGGVNDEQECDDGTDPTNPCDDTGLTGQDICASLFATGVDSPFHGIDCDGDGETNEEECNNGTDPLDPCNNSYEDGDEICAAINAGATGFADVDCDGGGISDKEECENGTDPTDPCDDAPPTEPTTECWETATFNNTTCVWDITGIQPTEPTTECYEIATFNNSICDWEVSGAEILEPFTQCWETATFNDIICNWEITGTQPTEPTTACWETAIFNNTTCVWDVTGTQPSEPTTQCWETASFNNTTCIWGISGSQPIEPFAQCWETASFNYTTCVWEVTGTQDGEPTTECWETATFNNTTCIWDISSTEPTIECWETATLNNTTCEWEITGTQPTEPTIVNCWDNYVFNLDPAICDWENLGSSDDPGCDDGDCSNGLETWDGCDCVAGIPPIACVDDGDCTNGIEIWNETTCFCDVTPPIINCDNAISEDDELIYFDYDDCNALINTMANADYSEFQPEYNNTLTCGSVTATNIYRDESNINIHSCTPGLDNSYSMCVASLNSCDADFSSTKAVKFSISISPLSGDTITLSALEFMHNAPVEFDWINGATGLNNYPTLYGIQILQNGTEIYLQEDLPTSTDWSQAFHAFTGISKIEIDQQTTIDIILLSYCPIGASSFVTAWDLENLKVYGHCGSLDENLGDENANITGRVTSEYGEGITEVTMSIISDQPGYPISTETTEIGEYIFENNPMAIDYKVQGEKNDDYMNGVSTLDLVLIQKHILNISLLDSPYKLIAADINNNERVSAIDLIELRKLILGVYSELPNNESWIFVDADATMNETNPWPFSELVQLTNLESDISVDFVGIKVGDVNGSVELSLQGQSADLRSSRALNFNIEEVELGQGITELKFTSSNFEQIAGFQFTLDGITEITEVASGQLTVAESNISTVEGSMVMSWNNDQLISIGDAVLFTVKVLKGQTTSLSITDRVAHSEAYQGEELDVINVNLESLKVSDNTLGQNIPNPWRSESTINFTLAEAGNASLTIYDITGKVLFIETANYSAGSQQLIIKGKDLGLTSGVLYYKLESGKFAATKKMLLID